MKKAVVFALLLTMSLSVVGCSKEQVTKNEPAKKESNVTDKDNETKVKDSVVFSIDGNELSYPQDFTYENLTSMGVSTTQKAPFLTSYGEDGTTSIKYDNGLTVLYQPDNYVITDIDNMHITGFNYTGSDIKVLSGVDSESPQDTTSDTEKLFINDSFTVSMTYTQKNGEAVLEGASLSSNTEDNFYQASKEVKTEGITDLTVTNLLNADGTINFVSNSEKMVFPSDNLPRNRMMPYVPLEIGFTNDVPNYILKNTDTTQDVIGIVLNEDNMGVSDIKIGDNFYQSLKKLGIEDDVDTNIVRLSEEDEDLVVYLQNESNEVSQITIVTEER